MSSDDGVNVTPAQVIKKLVDLGVERTSHATTSGNFEIHYFDLTPLKIKSTRFARIAFSRKPARGLELSLEETDELISHAETALTSSPATPGDTSDEEAFIVIVQCARLPNEVRARRSLPRRPNYVILDVSDCRAIRDSAQRIDALRAISRACSAALGTLHLSPYVPASTASGYRFFGRQALLKRVIAQRNASITLIGTRRIGKTSLLQELRRQLKLMRPELPIADLYGSNLDSVYEVLKRIVTETMPAARAAQLINRNEKDLIYELRKFVESSKYPLAIFIDEFDHILGWDSIGNFRLLNLLRELSKSELCAFYFAGFESTLKAVEDVRNPLYNFTSPERILPFQRHETFEMVELPMENLGVPVTVAGLADLIHRESGGQPELIQHICSKIVEIFSETHRVVTPDELSSYLTSDSKFESLVFRQLSQNVPSRDLLSLLLFMQSLGGNLDTAAVTFTASELIGGVQSASTHYHITTSLEHCQELAGSLETAGVITRTGSRAPITYKFSVPRLGDYYMVIGLDKEIRRLAQSAA